MGCRYYTVFAWCRNRTVSWVDWEGLSFWGEQCGLVGRVDLFQPSDDAAEAAMIRWQKIFSKANKPMGIYNTFVIEYSQQRQIKVTGRLYKGSHIYSNFSLIGSCKLSMCDECV